MKRIILSILTTVLLLSSILLSANSTLGQEELIQNSEFYIQGPENEDIDIDFIQDIVTDLANIVNIDEQYFRGRSFGTIGEVEAANILKNYWDTEIANDEVEPAVLEEVEKGPLGLKINKKIDVKSNNDFSLTLNINNQVENVAYTELYPMHKIGVSKLFPEKINSFTDAQVHLAPSIVYSISNLDELGGQGQENTRESSNDGDHIYLIDMGELTSSPLYDIIGDYLVLWVIEKLHIFTLFSPNYPTADGFLCADFNQDTHFMVGLMPLTIPGFMINGELGESIKNSIINNGDDSVTADFFIHSYYLENLESYNVLGTIPGKSSEKKIVMGAHYDSYWGQCVNDNANAVGILFSIAKYLVDNSIVPDYDIVFAAWAGEELGWRGSKSFVYNHRYEDIKYYINTDVVGQQVGEVNGVEFQKSDVCFKMGHSQLLDQELKDLISDIDYQDLSGGYCGINTNVDDIGDMCNHYLLLSDSEPFLGKTEDGVFEFHKGFLPNIGNWYHRSGNNYQAGDVLEKIDWQDINATANAILEVLEYLAFTEDGTSNGNNNNAEPESMETEMQNEELNSQPNSQTTEEQSTPSGTQGSNTLTSR